MRPGAPRPRGFALAAVLGLFVLLGVVAGIAWAQLSAQRLSRRAEEHRTQALWLARSAVFAGQPGTRELEVSGERATLVVRKTAAGTEAEVRFPRWGTAKVTESHPKDSGAGWEERWERGSTQ